METLKEAIKYLKIHGEDISKGAREDNSICKEIVRLYCMVYRYHCKGSIGLLLGAIDEYRNVKYTL